MSGAPAASAAAAAALPPPRLLIRDKDGVRLETHGGSASTPLATAADAVSLLAFSPNGLLVALALPTCVRVHSLTDGALLTSIPVALPASAFSFSPTCSHLLLWHRRVGEEPNLLVHWMGAAGARSPGVRIAAFHQRNYDAAAWPYVSWASDGSVAARVSADGVQFFEGDFKTTTPLTKLPLPGVKAAWFGPGPAPFPLLTFKPREGSRPGAAALWTYPKLGVPIASRSLQADDASVKWAPDGSGALVEMSTPTSDSGCSSTLPSSRRCWML